MDRKDVAKRLTKNIIEPPKTISDRFIKMRICTQADNNAFAIVFSVYALPSSDTKKNGFTRSCAAR